jgi:hypothetical protein
MMNLSQRKLKSGEKAFFLITLLSIVLLIAAGQMSRSNSDLATPERSCQLLVRAMWNNDHNAVRRLSTVQGFAVLQRARQDRRFGSYEKLANRMLAEFGSSQWWEKPITNNPGWGIAKSGRFGKDDGSIYFRRSPEGWKLDDYKPSSESGLKRNRARSGVAWDLRH